MRDDDDLLTIGEIAKLDGISTKALRYYDAHGILTPLETDPRTGYRYYAPDQLLEMDVIHLCLDAGVPLDSIDSFHQTDGSLDWRALMETGRDRVAREIARLRTLETSLNDYLGEVTRKARTPDDGIVHSNLPSTWMVGVPWPYYGGSFMLKPYLRTMTSLRETIRNAKLPRLLRRGILIDCRTKQAYVYQQFEPNTDIDNDHYYNTASSSIVDTSSATTDHNAMATVSDTHSATASNITNDTIANKSTTNKNTASRHTAHSTPHTDNNANDNNADTLAIDSIRTTEFNCGTANEHGAQMASAFGFAPPLAVFHPTGGPAEGRVIERESLSSCFDEAFAIAAQNETGEWQHITICEIWGSHTADGSIRVRMTRHRCDAGRVRSTAHHEVAH